ncbi:unnamed protein product [Arctogadus glacialis]
MMPTAGRRVRPPPATCLRGGACTPISSSFTRATVLFAPRNDDLLFRSANQSPGEEFSADQRVDVLVYCCLLFSESKPFFYSKAKRKKVKKIKMENEVIYFARHRNRSKKRHEIEP